MARHKKLRNQFKEIIVQYQLHKQERGAPENESAFLQALIRAVKEYNKKVVGKDEGGWIDGDAIERNELRQKIRRRQEDLL